MLVGPHDAVTIPMPVDVDPTLRDVQLTVRWERRAPTWFADAGQLVAWDQVEVRPPRRRAPVPSDQTVSNAAAGPVEVTPRLDIWRAPIDNDGFKLMPDLGRRIGVGGPAMQRWLDAGLDRLDPESLVGHRHTERSVGDVVVHRHVIEVPESMADLPRLGVSFDLPERFRVLRWHGRGPHENYPDRSRSALLGIWEGEPDESPYLVPQEFGLRTDCRWFEIRDPDTGDTVRIEAITPSMFHASAIRHTANDLYTAATATELQPRDHLTIHIDAAHRGLGTASCGPDVAPEYRIEPGRHELAYAIRSGGPSN